LSRNHGIYLLLATALALGTWTGARAETEAPEAAEIPEVQQPAPPSTETSAAAAARSDAPMPIGNIADGKAAYEVCAVCHLENAAGRPDGIFPQLAGQYASVTYQQITDTRDKLRSNPIMCPFVVTLTDSQVIADLATYLESLPLPLDNGKGPGNDYALGAQLYTRDCADCHGDRGQGSAAQVVPMVASQHFAYLVRQIDDIAGRHRKNADLEMVQVVSSYTQREREAVADFISRLEELQQLVPVPEATPE
jgi:cytochrome c553